MTYEIKDNPVHGKMLAENGKIIITDRFAATQLAERFNAQLVKAHSNRYMVQLPESANSIEECDCEAGQLQPDTYNQYPDHEVQMARQELYRTAKLAIMTHELLKQVGERQGLEGWVQSKLTRAADYIETVFDYLDYEMRYPSEMYNEADLNPGGSAQATPGTTQAGQQGLKPGQAPIPPADGKTQTPGMVKMAKVDMNGKIQGQPIMVPQNSIKSKQQAGFRVVGESATGGASSAGGMASSTGFGNGFLNGGPGAITRRPKKKKRTTEAWDMLDPGKPYGLANPRILTVGDDPQGIADFAVTGKNVLGIRPFNANQWNNTQQDARNHGYMLKYTGTNPEKAVVANSGDAPRLGHNMRGDKLESVAEADSMGRANTPSARFRQSQQFVHDPDRAAVIYKPNKYDPETGLGGYVANRASNNEKSNIMLQLNANLDSAYSKPIRFDDGTELKIGPNIARKTLNKLNSMRPVQRHDAVKNIIASKDAFVAFVKGSNEGVVEDETGPKFTGYWKGKDKGKPGKKMVGSN